MVTGEQLLWAQLAVLAITALLVWKYVRSTEEIMKAAVRQAELTGDQVEAMSRPVLVPRGGGHLANFGNGPALRVEWWVRPESEAFAAPPDLLPDGEIGLIEPGGRCGMMGLPDFDRLKGNNRKIVCRYRSISGRAYLSQGIPRDDPTTGVWWFQSETIEERRF